MPPEYRFYVYEHWRPDKDLCFWVGKGNGDRAYRFRRNRYYDNIVAKLARLGMCIEVRMVASGLTEPAALTLEIERIAFWRSLGVELANLTDGGEGVCGHRHSEETRATIRKKRSLQKICHSEETKRKIGSANSAALKGKKNPEHSVRLKGRKLSPQHRAAIGASLKGTIFTDERRANISAGLKGKSFTGERIENLRKSHLGKRPTEANREKMRAAQRARWAKVRENA